MRYNFFATLDKDPTISIRRRVLKVLERELFRLITISFSVV